jgi:hypothetical protein
MRTVFEQLAQDLCYGVRGLRRSRAFLMTTVLTLAAGAPGYPGGSVPGAAGGGVNLPGQAWLPASAGRLWLSAIYGIPHAAFCPKAEAAQSARAALQ